VRRLGDNVEGDGLLGGLKGRRQASQGYSNASGKGHFPSV